MRAGLSLVQPRSWREVGCWTQCPWHVSRRRGADSACARCLAAGTGGCCCRWAFPSDGFCLRQEIQRLSEQLAAKEAAARQRAGPGPEREEELAALRRRVAEKERARAASDTLCRSLADESRQLRRTLAATAHMCQHLARRLEAGQGAAGEQRPEVGTGHRGGRPDLPAHPLRRLPHPPSPRQGRPQGFLPKRWDKRRK